MSLAHITWKNTSLYGGNTSERGPINNKYVTTGLENGLAANSLQRIILSNNGLFYWCVCHSASGCEVLRQSIQEVQFIANYIYIYIYIWLIGNWLIWTKVQLIFPRKSIVIKSSLVEISHYQNQWWRNSLFHCCFYMSPATMDYAYRQVFNIRRNLVAY